MENTMSEEYVAELLKQLKELKRKKSRKEKKLQKLKSGEIKDTKIDGASSRKTPDENVIHQASISKSSTNQTFLKKTASENSISLKKQTHTIHCHNSFDSTSTKLDDNPIQEDLHDYRKIDSLHFDDDKSSEINLRKQNEFSVQNEECIKNSACAAEMLEQNEIKEDNKVEILQKCNLFCNHVFETDICQKCFKMDFMQSDGNQVECEVSLSNKHKSPFLDNVDRLTCNNETSCLDAEKLKPNGNTTQNWENNAKFIHDIGENKKVELSVKMEAVSIHAPVTINDCKLSSSLDKRKSPDRSEKSPLSSKTKSSDILDDSLNEKMGFLFCDLFDNKKETFDNYNGMSTSDKNGVESPKQIEKVSKVIPCGDNPMSSNLPSNPSQKINFNFPKFSTPTDMCLSVDADICHSDKDESLYDLTKQEAPKASNSVENATRFSENINLLNAGFKSNVYSQNNFDPSHISDIIGKGLSSVLDAHYESPKKSSPDCKLSSNPIWDSKGIFRDITSETVFKRRKLFENSSSIFEPESKIKKYNSFALNLELNVKSNDALNRSFESVAETDKQINDDYVDFDNIDAFGENSDYSSNDLQNNSNKPVTFAQNSCGNVPSQITKAVDGIVSKVCEDFSLPKQVNGLGELDITNIKSNVMLDENTEVNSEIQIIPETEGLGLYFSKDSEDFLETSMLSQNLKVLNADGNLLNVSSQSKLKSPVMNNTVETIKASTTFNCHYKENGELHNETDNFKMNSPVRNEEERVNEKVPNGAASEFENTLGLGTSFLEDDTQDLRQVPYMNTENVQVDFTTEEMKTESNLNFTCSLYGATNEPVIDVEIIVFGGVKYSFIQHATQIHVWRQEKTKGWIKIFSHHIEDMLSLIKICVSMDDDNLIIVMLLSDDEKYCLQFLLFEKDTRVIKLMENTHWLEERYLKDSILLCGLNGLMFATAQNKKNSEVSLHAFISLKESPRLMTAVLGSTDSRLGSLCKIDKLPNALMGISDSMLYVWHILEARLVTAVSLHPHDYLPIKECFWATVENGLIYFLTICEDEESHQVCQLLAANLATGFCQSAMTYSTQPSNNKVVKIIKAAYMEPFLVVAHSNGAFVWSVMEEYCSAALSSKSNVTTIAINKDFQNWGLIAIGTKFGSIDCYSVN